MIERNIGTPGEYYLKLSLQKAIGGFTASAEYLAIMNPEIKRIDKKTIPAKSIKPKSLPYILNDYPLTEFFMSYWRKDAPGQEHLPLSEILPSETLVAWDIEYFDHSDPGKILREPEKVFKLLEPTYQIMQDVLLGYGIDFIAVMTGRGYHFITKAPYNSQAMHELIKAGNFIEPAVAAYQAKVPLNSKRDRPVPPLAELAYLGAGKLQQYIFNKVITLARERSLVPVEVSDRETNGTSLDNTTVTRHLETAKIGVPGSIYIKHYIHPHQFDHDTAWRSPILIRIVRAKGSEEFASVQELMEVRTNFGLAIENLIWSKGEIPDGSEGLKRALGDYLNSDLRQLHLAMDTEEIDDPKDWDHTYRNYEAIITDFPELGDILINANPKLLQPDSLNYFINTIYNQWGSASHVVGLLCAIYEDNRFDWGKRFRRHELAQRHAKGWVMIILGQRFEQA